jgi:hypothetical protein
MFSLAPFKKAIFQVLIFHDNFFLLDPQCPTNQVSLSILSPQRLFQTPTKEEFKVYLIDES